MSNRSQTGHTNTGGPQAYTSEVEYFVACFSKREVRDRVNGLFETQLYEWIANNPSTDVAKLLAEQSTQMDLERENWAWSLTQANQQTFETFVDNEHRDEYLNAIIEAEAERKNPRGDRIGYVNQRKAELS